MAEILLCGAGQLGSRYLQGLSLTCDPHNITVFDPSSGALDLARDRYNEVCDSGQKHNLKFTSDIAAISRYLDLAIVATTSFPRAKIVAEIAITCHVRFWILEKVLAPSISELDAILVSTGSSQGAWVNHWMRTTPWALGLKSMLSNVDVRNASMSVAGGGWGLACNATHFLDLLCMVTGESVTSVLVDKLDRDWTASKRSGYFEILGTMEAIFGSKARLILNCDSSNEPLTLSVSVADNQYEVKFDGDDSIEVKVNDKLERFDFPYQSTMTAEIVDEILLTAQCDLPTCLATVTTHRPFIRALIGHWNSNHSDSVKRLPIT
jgi:hypothetical protein